MADLAKHQQALGRGKLNFIGTSQSGKNISILNRKIMKIYTDIRELFSYLFNIKWNCFHIYST